MNNLLQDTTLSYDDDISLYTLREKGKKIFSEQGLPTKKSENWKYTSLRALERNDYIINDKECDHKHCSHDTSFLPFDAYEISFCNGKICHLTRDIPKGVILCSLLEAFFEYDIKKKINAYIDIEKQPFCALNTAYLENGIYLEVSENIDLQKPIALIHKTHTDGENLLINTRNIIVLNNRSNIKFIEYYHYSGEQKSEYLLNIVNEIFLGKEAKLEHIKIQKDAFYANHIAYNAVYLKESAKYNGFCLQKGANIGRNETNAELAQERSDFKLNGAYIMNGWALLDTETKIEHLSPETFSKQLVRGVIGGKAHGVFQGKISIAPHADKSEGNQLHRALLLSDEAEVDYKPELEIYADDVKCSHGATCGQIDKDMLYYMRSRGIGEEDAKKILIAAYLRDTFDIIEEENIRNWIENEL